MSYIRNNKALLLIIAVLLIANIVLLYLGVWNKDKKDGPEPRGAYDPSKINEKVRMKLQNEVGFNQQQVDQYGEMRKKNFETLGPMFDELRVVKDSFFNLLYQPTISDTAISMYGEKVCKKQQAIDAQMLKYLRTVRDLATAEQKPRIDSFLSNIIRRMSGGPRHPGQQKKDKQ